MISKEYLQRIAAGFLVTAVALSATTPFTRAQSVGGANSTPAQSLDYEFFKTRVEPIFLKKRAGHTRCYACHSGEEGPQYLEKLTPGSTFWTEEQSRLNFKKVSLFVVPGNLTASKLLMHPLAPEAGGEFPSPLVHMGGRQFASKDDPDWQTFAAWVRGAKAGDPPER